MESPILPTFHPGNFDLPKKPKKPRAKRCFDSVLVRKPILQNIPKLAPKDTFEPESPHMLYIAYNVPTMWRCALQFMGQSITERYIYFDDIRRMKADPKATSFLKHPTMASYLRNLLIWAKREQNVRTQMRKLVALWLLKRYQSRMLNTEDPATLCEPDSPVLLFDAKARGSYVYEATTLKRQLEENLGYCKWLVSEPQAPKNPLTNLRFHTGQVVEIFRQLTIYGTSSWILEGFKEHHYNLHDFLEFFRQPLRMRAVDACRKAPTSEDTLDFVSEFIEDEFEYHDIPYKSTLTILKWALEHKSDLIYVRRWVDTWSEYYKATILYGDQTVRDHPRLVDFAHDMSFDLFQNKTMIQKLGRMRLENRLANSHPAPVVSPPRDEPEVNILVGITEQDTSLPLSVYLVEALLNHEPPSD